MPNTEAGRALSRRMDGTDTWMTDAIEAIETEAAKAEADRWRRLPGAYRREDGGTDIVVDVPETVSFLLDEFPDEVSAIVASAQALDTERLARAICVSDLTHYRGWNAELSHATVSQDHTEEAEAVARAYLEAQ